jgi:hypothetical protein
MWARVKGKTENALLALPFAGAYMFGPGYIQPIGGVKSKTGWVQAAYTVLAPHTKRILYSSDINALAEGPLARLEGGTGTMRGKHL